MSTVFVVDVGAVFFLHGFAWSAGYCWGHNKSVGNRNRNLEKPQHSEWQVEGVYSRN